MPTSGTLAARTAAPHPPSTSHNVPMNSAMSFRVMCVPPKRPYGSERAMQPPVQDKRKVNGAGKFLAFRRNLPRERRPRPKSKTARDVSVPRRLVSFGKPLDELQIDCLRTALVGFDLEADPLAFIEAAQTRRLDRRDMDEHVLAAAFRCDESEALGSIEKFDLSGRHYGFLLKAFRYAEDTMFAASSKSRLFSGKASSSLQRLQFPVGT